MLCGLLPLTFCSRDCTLFHSIKTFVEQEEKSSRNCWTCLPVSLVTNRTTESRIRGITSLASALLAAVTQCNLSFSIFFHQSLRKNEVCPWGLLSIFWDKLCEHRNNFSSHEIKGKVQQHGYLHLCIRVFVHFHKTHQSSFPKSFFQFCSCNSLSLKTSTQFSPLCPTVTIDVWVDLDPRLCSWTHLFCRAEAFSPGTSKAYGNWCLLKAAKNISIK